MEKASLILGMAATIITLITSIVAGILYLKKHIREWISNVSKDDFDELKTLCNDMSDKIDHVDMRACKNFLVNIIAQIESGVQPSEIALERFHELYDRYEEKGCNGYIKSKVKKLQSEGKL